MSRKHHQVRETKKQLQRFMYTIRLSVFSMIMEISRELTILLVGRRVAPDRVTYSVESSAESVHRPSRNQLPTDQDAYSLTERHSYNTNAPPVRLLAFKLSLVN